MKNVRPTGLSETIASAPCIRSVISERERALPRSCRCVFLQIVKSHAAVGAALELIPRPERVQIRILHQILRLRAAARQTQCEAVHRVHTRRASSAKPGFPSACDAGAGSAAPGS
jgi:hypothetical protein